MSESTISAIAALLHLNPLSARDYKRLVREGGHAVDEDEVKRVCLRIRTAWDEERASIRAEVERLRAKDVKARLALDAIARMNVTRDTLTGAVVTARAALAEREKP